MKKILLRLVALMMVIAIGLSISISGYAAVAKNKYASWTNSVVKKIGNATANKKLTISTDMYTSFAPAVRDALMERPDIQLTVKWKQDGETKKFVILAGTDVSQVFDEKGYAGFAYLQGFFGEKGKTVEAKAIQTRKNDIPIAAAVVNLKSYAGNNDEFNAYNYYKRYEDLQTAFGPDGDKLLNHYISCGKKEGRDAK